MSHFFQHAAVLGLLLVVLLSATLTSGVAAWDGKGDNLAAVEAFESQALAMRNATDAAFLDVQDAMTIVEAGEGNETLIQDAITAFYFTTSNASRSVMETLPIPEGLDPDVAGLLETARRVLMQSLQDRMNLAAALSAGASTASEDKPGAALLARQFAVRTGARDLSLGLVLQEARDAATE